MTENSNTSLLGQALSIANHPEATIVALGVAPAQGRSLFARMNLKVKVLALSSVIIPAVLIAHGLGPSEGSKAAQTPISNAQTSVGLSASAERSTLPAAAKSEAPAVATPVAAAAQAPAAAGAPVVARSSQPDRLENALPNLGKGMNSYQLSTSLMAVDLFASLATAVEDFKRKPYYDPGGLNVGMGYCITKRVAEYGADRVRSDLSSAGFAPSQVESLIKNKKAEVQKIIVEPMHAVRLLEATKEDYRSLAEAGIGKQVFDKLPPNRQAALTYLAYNTGNVGQFKNLVSAVNHGHDSKAMLNLTVNWRDTGGEVHANHRQRSYLQAMFLGTEHFKRAISDPNAFESHIGAPKAEGLLAEIAGAAQTPNGLRSKLLERRLKANPWASKALDQEKQTHAAPNIKGL
jgi:GH24 family phage-related lysozyme (muramidase)